MAKNKSTEDLKKDLADLQKKIDGLVKSGVTGEAALAKQLASSIEGISKNYSKLLSKYEGTIKRMLSGAEEVRKVVKALKEENKKGGMFNTPEAENFFDKLVDIVDVLDEEAAALKRNKSLYQEVYDKIEKNIENVVKQALKHQSINKVIGEDSALRIKELSKEKGLAKFMARYVDDRKNSLREELELKRAQSITDKRSGKDNGEVKKRISSIKKELEALSGVESIIQSGAKHDKLHDSIKKGLDSTAEKYRSLLSMIPVLGPILIQQLDTFQQHLGEASKKALDHMEDGNTMFSGIREGLGHINSKMTGWGGLALKVSLIVGGIYTLFNLIDRTLKDISTSTGLSGNQAYKLYKSSLATQTTYANQLSNQKEILDVHKALVNETGLLLDYSGAMVGKVSDMSKYFGYSQETGGRLHNMMMQLSGSMPLKQSEELATKMQFITATLAESAGIAPGIVTKDLVDNAEYVSRTFAGMPEQAALAAVEVRKLGSSLSQAAKITEHLFDVSGSLTAAMEASVATGKLIDTNAARDLAMKGKSVELMKEIANQAGSYNDFSRMNVGQRILLSRALGMESSELMKMLFVQDRLTYLTDEQKKNMLESGLTLQQMQDMSAQDIRLKVKQANQAEKFETSMGKVKAALVETILPVVETLVPLLGVVANIVSAILYVLKPIKWLFESINEAVKEIGHQLSFVGGIASSIASVFSTIDEGLEDSSKNASVIKKTIGFILLGLGSIALFAGKLPKVIKAIFSLANPFNWFKFVGQGFKSTIDKAKNLMNILSGKNAAAVTPEVRSKAEKRSKGARKAAYGKPTAKGGKGAGNIGGRVSELAKSSKLLNPKTILSLSVAMIAFASSLWILGKAGQELDKVKWKKAGIGIGIFVGSMISLMVVAQLAPAAALGLGVMALAMLSFGLSMLMVGKASQLAGKGFATITDSIIKLSGTLNLKLINLLSGLGASVLLFSTALATGIAMISAASGLALLAAGGIAIITAAMLSFGLTMLMVGEAAQLTGQGISLISNSVSTLVNSIRDLSVDNLKNFVWSLKDLAIVLKDLDIEVLDKLAKFNQAWSGSKMGGSVEYGVNAVATHSNTSLPSSTDAKSSSNSSGVNNTGMQMAGVEERLTRIERIMNQLYLVTRDNAQNPPRIVIDFGDGAVRELKVRMTKN